MSDAFTPEILQSFSNMLAAAIQASATGTNEGTMPARTLPRPPFNVSAYQASDGTSIADYFTRFTWALKLSQIPEDQHANYARVYMGPELNNTLKFLVSPRDPEMLTYSEITNKLATHFDATRNEYSESKRFRETTQRQGENVANFALRLKQAAAYCNYGEFLDRMLREQLVFGLEAREMCDKIIAKKPKTFSEAYEIAHALEATRNATEEVKTPGVNQLEPTHKIGYEKPHLKKSGKQVSGECKHRYHDHQMTSSQRNNQTRQGNQRTCAGCGEAHMRSQCRFRNAECNKCGKKGHISRVCRSCAQTNQVCDSEDPTEEIDMVRQLNKLEFIGSIPYTDQRILDVKIDGATVEMEFDTGSPCAIMCKDVFGKINPNFELQATDRKFASYTGHPINCIGRTQVTVTMGATTKQLYLYVVNEDHDTLFGREWIEAFVHEIPFEKLFTKTTSVHHTSIAASPTMDQQKQLDKLLTHYSDVFSDTPGKLSGPPVKMKLKPGATPIFSRAREVPFALRDAYAREIDTKIASGFYKRVDHSEWASTTHIVAKKNGKIRITGNYKPTLNPKILIDEHPIPKVEHLFNKLKGATLFCHLDVVDAYTHLEVDEEFSHALTLNTPTHGLIRPTRAVYGAANIPAIWQRRMETVLQDLPNVVNFFDDIIVYADQFDNLLKALTATLDRFRSHGIKLNRAKCSFAEPVLEALGHKVDASGVHKSDAHIRAVRDAPKPSTPEELQLFLGKATYYNAFIPDLSTRDRPLRDMLLKDPFKWTLEGTQAYLDIKETLTSPKVLMLYDPSLPLLLAVDASKTGLGAVLSHRLNNGQERPIAYASRTLSATEQRYPQIDKEALAIVWAVQKFFNYLYARHFTLITDHKPLTQILHPEKSLPVLCISRMANYADYLANFDYDVIFKASKANANADYCSRTPLPPTIKRISKLCSSQGKDEAEDFDEFDKFVVHQTTQLPIRAEVIARETRKDFHLGKIVQLLETGQNLARHHYKNPEVQYTLAANCLMFEHRVVIPPTLKEAILKDLHAAHLGMVKMKGIARSFVFWPGIDADIERVAKSCTGCATHGHAPPKFREHHWEYPKAPWERIHIDYAGPIEGTMLLIIVDAYSKWLEVKTTSSATATSTITILDELFTSYGCPITVVSDNGRQFVSEEFTNFLRESGVKYHKLTAAYHPSTNGQAERYVQTVKDALHAMKSTKGSLKRDLNVFLRQYRRAPHTTTGMSPARLFLGRELRTRMNLVRPDDVYSKVMQKQQAQMNSTFRTLQAGQPVYFLSGNPRLDKWIPGVVMTRLGDLHYEIEYGNKKFKRHIDQIRKCDDREQPKTGSFELQDGTQVHGRRLFYAETVTPTTPTTPETPTTPATPVTPRRQCIQVPRNLFTPQNLRRSNRIRYPPLRFSPN